MRLTLVLTIALLFGPREVESVEIRHRIVLKRGHREAIVSGRIPTPDDIAVYFMRLQAGQHLSVELSLAPTLRAWAVLRPPSGDQIGPATRIDSVANQTGEFQIRVIPLEQTSGDFRLHVNVQ